MGSKRDSAEVAIRKVVAGVVALLLFMLLLAWVGYAGAESSRLGYFDVQTSCNRGRVERIIVTVVKEVPVGGGLAITLDHDAACGGERQRPASLL